MAATSDDLKAALRGTAQSLRNIATQRTTASKRAVLEQVAADLDRISNQTIDALAATLDAAPAPERTDTGDHLPQTEVGRQLAEWFWSLVPDNTAVEVGVFDKMADRLQRPLLRQVSQAHQRVVRGEAEAAVRQEMDELRAEIARLKGEIH